MNTPISSRSLRHLLIASLITLVASSCAVSTSSRGDEAYKQGEFSKALELYEEAIKDGNRDPEVFYRAAQTSLKLGDLATAERYYSRSIRYGGGVPVMRALAQLYIQTSNYTRAAQVLYELLNFDPDQQPIYNNLGTSLMYAGSPLAAESYLLIAQQMDPADPIPYVNLGLLYDRHMNRVSLGAEFYQCYVSMSSSDAEQRRQIVTRLNEIGAVAPALDSPKRVVACGEVYQPPKNAAPALGTLREEFGVAADSPSDQHDRREAIELDVSSDHGDGAPPMIETGGKPAEKVVVVTEPTNTPPDQDKQGDARARARELYGAGDFGAAARALESIPIDKISADDARLMARIQESLKSPADAETWWRLSLSKEAHPIALGALMKLLRKQDRARDLQALCAMYKGREEFEPVAHYCSLKP